MPSLEEPPGGVGTLGAALREVRERAGQSIEQVAASTRIRSTLIRDLEADRLASSGAAVYLRGHVRAIANAVHADPAPLLLLCDAAGAPSASASVLIPELRPDRPRGSSMLGPAAMGRMERRGPRWGLAVTGALVVLAAVIVVQGRGGPAPHPLTSVDGLGVTGSASASSPPSHAAPRPSPGPTALDPGAVAKLPAPVGAQLRVRLIGGASWVLVRHGAAVLFEGVLAAGSFRDFSDPTSLKIKVGNAAAVNLNCGGKDGGAAGGAGMIASFTCTAGGLSPS